MDVSLKVFLYQFIGVVSLAMLAVLVVAFLSMPLSLGMHPGEERPASAPPRGQPS